MARKNDYVFTEEHRKNLSEKAKLRKQTDKTKKKISQANKGRKVSKETRKLISESLTGITRSQATKDAISRARKGRKEKPITLQRKSDAQEPNKKAIIGVHKKDGTVISLRSVSDVRKLGMKQPNVTANLHGRIKSAYGYIWKFADENEEVGNQ